MILSSSSLQLTPGQYQGHLSILVKLDFSLFSLRKFLIICVTSQISDAGIQGYLLSVSRAASGAIPERSCFMFSFWSGHQNSSHRRQEKITSFNHIRTGKGGVLVLLNSFNVLKLFLYKKEKG